MNIAGHKINNWYVVGGAAGLGAVWWVTKHKQAAAAQAASSPASASAIDPVTNMPYSMDNSEDPVTGLTYLQEAQEYGSVQAAEEEVTSGSAYYGVTGSSDAVDSGTPTYTYEETSATGPGSYSNNAQWAQAVTSGLAALNYDSGTVSAALGAFFAQMPLNSSQASIIQAAEAEYGPPPQGTYSIIPEPSSGGATTPTSQYTTPGGFTGSVQNTSGSFAWGQTPDTPATWTITQGSTVVDSETATSNANGTVHISVGNLKAKTAYVLTVTANGGTGTFSFTTF